MTHSFSISTGSKEDRYLSLLPQLRGLVKGEENLISNLANISAVLKEAFGFFWVGFYLVEGNSLVLGPFQGSVACTRIEKGKGVCGTAFEREETLIVPDVDAFPGHIACSSFSKSEIVVPVMKNGKVVMVIDIDSDKHDDFDETDKNHLEELAKLISEIC